MLNTKYVLITPARNEEAFIEKTLASMAAQTVLPQRWVIVDDGSTDQTAEIVQSYASRVRLFNLGFALLERNDILPGKSKPLTRASTA